MTVLNIFWYTLQARENEKGVSSIDKHIAPSYFVNNNYYKYLY